MTGFPLLAYLEKGLPNLLKHIETITEVYRLPAVVAINKFPTDTDAELALYWFFAMQIGSSARPIPSRFLISLSAFGV